MSAAWKIWRHILVLALVLPLALSSALPMFARALGGPAVHLCHCEIRGGHSTCACPICNPDRDDLLLSDASLRGKCGDDDVVFGAVLGSAILAPPGVTILRPEVVREAPPLTILKVASVFLTPPTPPPEFQVS